MQYSDHAVLEYIRLVGAIKVPRMGIDRPSSGAYSRAPRRTAPTGLCNAPYHAVLERFCLVGAIKVPKMGIDGPSSAYIRGRPRRTAPTGLCNAPDRAVLECFRLAGAIKVPKMGIDGPSSAYIRGRPRRTAPTGLCNAPDRAVLEYFRLAGAIKVPRMGIDRPTSSATINPYNSSPAGSARKLHIPYKNLPRPHIAATAESIVPDRAMCRMGRHGRQNNIPGTGPLLSPCPQRDSTNFASSVFYPLSS